MNKPDTILYIILTAVIQTSSNTALQNQLGVKIGSICPGLMSAIVTQEDIYKDIQPSSNEPAKSLPTYIDNCGLLVQVVEYVLQLR